MPFGGFCPLPLRLGGSELEGWSPEQHARMAADMLAVRRTAPFAVMGFTLQGGICTVNSYRGQHSISLADAPSPSVASGTITFAWDPVYASAYAVPLAVSLLNATGTVHGPTSGRLRIDTITTSSVAVTPVRRDNGADLDATCSLIVY